MGIVWEAYHKGVPLLGVPGITLDVNTAHYEEDAGRAKFLGILLRYVDMS